MAPLTNQSTVLGDGTKTTRAMIRAQIRGVVMRNCYPMERRMRPTPEPYRYFSLGCFRRQRPDLSVSLVCDWGGPLG